ncbi:hypothetical protein [Deinococcus sp.]|uniref:hypothetical protein n=1 Tax=Deinococcus sp. TaxID=47478 RepID=UPI003B5AD4B2
MIVNNSHGHPPPAVQAYLQAATRTLPRQTREKVIAELHANLHQRMLDYSLELGRDEAWMAALRDFGSPEVTARAFGGQRWPGRLRLGLAVLALGGAGYAAARTVAWPLDWAAVVRAETTQPPPAP